MLGSLFNDLSVAHERLSRAAGTMSLLCKVMTPEQLMLIIKSWIWPMIQLNTTPGLFDMPAQMEKKELPDDKLDRIKNTMILRPEEKELRKQFNFSPTRLLVTTLAYYIHKQFIQGTTMAELQRKYVVWPQTLALCITGRSTKVGLTGKPKRERNGGVQMRKRANPQLQKTLKETST